MMICVVYDGVEWCEGVGKGLFTGIIVHISV